MDDSVSLTQEQSDAIIDWAYQTGVFGSSPSSSGDELQVDEEDAALVARLEAEAARLLALSVEADAAVEAAKQEAEAIRLQAVAAETVVAEVSTTLALLDDRCPPPWWTPRDDELFAETMFVLNMKPPNLDHYLFAQAECERRFPHVRRSDWLEGPSLRYLERAVQPGGAICNHWRELKSKRARVSIIPAAGGRPRRGRAAPKRVWVDDDGESMYTDHDGNVLPPTQGGGGAPSARARARR